MFGCMKGVVDVAGVEEGWGYGRLFIQCLFELITIHSLGAKSLPPV